MCEWNVYEGDDPRYGPPMIGEGDGGGGVKCVASDDYIMSRHRGAMHTVSPKADLRRMMCELLEEAGRFFCAAWRLHAHRGY